MVKVEAIKVKVKAIEANAEVEIEDNNKELKGVNGEKEDLVVLPWERPTWMGMGPILMKVIFGIFGSNLISFCWPNKIKRHHYQWV